MILTAEILDRAGFPHGFPTRGVSDAALAAHVGVEGIGAVAQVKQVHGADAVDVADAAGAEADAIVAPGGTLARTGARRGPTAVGVRVADCVPVLIADPETRSVAAVHAGWRGVVADVLGSAVARVAAEGPLLAAIGPCIGGCCFEVGADVAARIAQAVLDPRVVVRQVGEKAYVDLRAAVRARLRALGLSDDRIEDVPGCTKHDAHFHSYRRDGASSGRMLAVIASPPPSRA
jgi:YfiH family protein